MKIGIVTCADWPQLLTTDQELIPLLAAKNILAEPVVWNDKTVIWEDYDCLLMRSMWDYYLHAADFEAWLNDLTSKKVKTLNSLAIIQANQHKFYLQKLAEQGVAIIPTIFLPKQITANGKFIDLSVIESTDWEKAVIKPAISAGSHRTTLFDKNNWRTIELEYNAIAKESDLLLQEFLPEIQTTGEISLIFFNRKFSHAVVKTPKEGDFRIQSQFGGHYQPYTPSETLLKTAEKIIACFEGELLYARIDGVVQNNQFLLMEVEQIEPDLYFHLHESAKNTFVEAILELL